ncbi:FolC bifunctional protein [Rhizopogon vinicolor AM-OR11-026]|uniref:Folylpolyglutamate synthase n=1 Tax=Rhizopogon vinicolor AM-OR11-026 TaxID=1314800 RepID=A0A1B7NHV5_9AGAM|nr:FolC bifunctional protein [Rhizopogon vinicolor AM-OR11-026]
MSTAPARTYKDAIDALNTLQSNAATLEAVRATGLLNPNAIPEMIDYLRRVDLEPPQLNDLNVIHITGTKGKGSASAFTDSILRTARPGWKTGLYTSPHLVAVRERIRINGEPLSEEDFTRYFFEVWDLLQKNSKCEAVTAPFMPNYFRFLTLMAFYTFKQLKVDAAILEVGIGGRSDSTNIVPKPVVTGITALGYDHTRILGNKLSQIANQKAGIYKEGVPALTVEQLEEGMSELRNCATEQGASQFTIVDSLPNTTALGLAGAHQRSNAALAVQLAHMFLTITDPSYSHMSNPNTSVAASTPQSRSVIEPLRSLPTSFLDGLKNAHWPGRCQTVLDPQQEGTKWFLDGAHTRESLECCLEWFVSPAIGLPDSPVSEGYPIRVLIFNCTSGRSGDEFLKAILQKIEEQLTKYGSPEKKEDFFAKVIFCSNVTYTSGNFKSDLTSVAMSTTDDTHLKTQREIEAAWNKLVATYSGTVHVLPAIEDAVREARKTPNVNVLVTGSLHLVGGVMEVAGLADRALSPKA